MQTTRFVKSALLGLGLTLAGACTALADGGDSSADANPGFAQVQAATALMIRVPINAQGQELTDAAQARLHTGADLSTSGDFAAAFAVASPLVDANSVTSTDIAKDSSTSGWFGWGSRNNCGWQASGWYYNYQPSYYSCGSYYNYYQPYYRDYCNQGGSYYGYRYYYYPRSW